MDQLITEDPTRIGPYRLIARLGAGGMGLVYLGRSEAGRTVAVKVVQAEHAAHPEFRKRFAREVAAARRVGGAWTAAVLDADTDAQVPWVATQYIPGPDLTTVVAKDFGPLPEQSVQVLANRLAEALAAVHGAGLIHRDLKPSNVLVTVDGPRVIDFGIARAMDSLTSDSLLTHTGMLIGSPGFMSPEQVRGLELTPASDVFCLGAVLVYAATGRLLFGAGTTGLNAHLFRIAEEEPDLVGVPEGLLDLVRACLHKDPAQRPTPAEIAGRTASPSAGEWLPGAVLAQLGRHAARLLDFAPETRAPVADPRIPAQAASATPAAVAPHAQPTDAASPAHARPTDAAPPAYAPRTPSPPVPGYVPTTPAHPSAPAAPPPRSRGTLFLAFLAQLLVVLDAALGSNVLLEHVVMDSALSTGDMAWVYSGYFLAFGGLLLIGGHLCDLIGRRATLLIGLTACVAAGVASGASPSVDVLLWARVLQGAGAALVTPAALGLTVTAAEGPARTRAFGTYALAGIGGPLFALPLARELDQYVAWRACFYILAALTLLVLIAAAAVVRDRARRSPAFFDPLGAALGSLGLVALAYSMVQAAALHWNVPVTIGSFAAGVLLIAAFLWSQTRTPTPILPPYVWQDPSRRGAVIALGLIAAPLAVLTQGQMTFSLMNGWNEVFAVGLAALIVFLISARLLAPRLSGVARLSGGLLLTAGGLVLLSFADYELYFATIGGGLALCAVGLGLSSGTLLGAATDVMAEDTGGMAGTVHAVLQAGTVVGMTLPTLLLGGGYAWVGHAGEVPAAVWWGAAAFLVVAALVASRSRREVVYLYS
ncbi:MFS transporter [Streptomyces sp. NPDC002773]|uniref:MFS transporter n=1 Tax=Streptomyces sp. NPDC002773 TaxID=3154430 RepID=UPI003317BD19